MTNTELTAAITAAIAADPELGTWSLANFGQKITVFDGIDRHALPQPPDQATAEAGDYPFVAVDIDERNTGTMIDGVGVNVALFAALLDDSPYTEDGQVRQLPGKLKREQLRTLLVGACAAAGLDYVVAEVTSTNLPVEFFPEFALDITLTLVREYQFRDDRLQ